MVNALNIGKNAMLVNQAGITVSSNNIANMNTEGYSKQRINLVSLYSKATASNTLQQARLGYGVDAESITRYRDAFTDSYYRNANASMNYYDIIATNGASLETIANEFSDTGLSAYFNSFFDAANKLSLYPTDITMKTNFAQEATNLALDINNIYSKLQNARTNLVGDINNPSSLQTSQVQIATNEVNEILKKIADINKDIIAQHSTSTGASPGLLDERDLLIDELSEYMKVDVTVNQNEGVTITTGNLQLIAGSEMKGQFVTHVGDENNPVVISFEDDAGYVYSADVKSQLGNSGKLGGILTLGGDSTSELTIKSMMDNLDNIANQLAYEINNIQLQSESGPPAMHSAYYNATAGELEITQDSIFVSKNGDGIITAASLAVNQNIMNNPEKIATAYVEVDEDGNIVSPDEIGNNKSAQAFVDLRSKTITALDGMTFEAYNTHITTDFASKLSSAKTNYTTQENVYNAAYTQRQSESGVSLEEELTDLVKFQRAYEASARIFTVSDEILQTLVNLGR